MTRLVEFAGQEEKAAQCFVSDFATWDDGEDTTVVDAWSPEVAVTSSDELPAGWATGIDDAQLVAWAQEMDPSTTSTEWQAVAA